MKELRDIFVDVKFEGEFHGVGVNHGVRRLYFTGPKEWLEDEYVANGAISARIMMEMKEDKHGETHIKFLMSPVFINIFGVEYEPDWYDCHKMINRLK